MSTITIPQVTNTELRNVARRALLQYHSRAFGEMGFKKKAHELDMSLNISLFEFNCMNPHNLREIITALKSETSKDDKVSWVWITPTPHAMIDSCRKMVRYLWVVTEEVDGDIRYIDAIKPFVSYVSIYPEQEVRERFLSMNV